PRASRRAGAQIRQALRSRSCDTEGCAETLVIAEALTAQGAGTPSHRIQPMARSSVFVFVFFTMAPVRQLSKQLCRTEARATSPVRLAHGPGRWPRRGV